MIFSPVPAFCQPDNMQQAIHLWRLFTLVELVYNMRQLSDAIFFDILNALRFGEMIPEHMSNLIKRSATILEVIFLWKRSYEYFNNTTNAAIHHC